MTSSTADATRPVSLREAGIFVAASLLACFLACVGRQVGTVILLVAGFDLGLAPLAVAACLWRARHRPAEALGWRLAAVSQGLFWVVSLQLFLSRGDLHLAARGMPANLLHSLVLAGAILAWPWRDRGGRRWLLHLLGSLLFAGSILFALWGLGSWQSATASGGFLNRLVLVNALRITLIGGLVLYLISERPQRARGPLGWLLANMLAAGVVGALAQILLRAGQTWVLPFGSVALLVPASLLLGALSPYAVEPPEASGWRADVWIRRWETLPYIPFGLASLTLVWVMARHAGILLGTLLGYIGLTALLVLRQILLLSELKESNRRLDERVQDRTRQLEAMQEAVLRTERMNTMAVLGAGLVHDLNNALNVVRGALELAEPGLDPDPAFLTRALGHLRSALERLSGLAARLMAFAREKPDAPMEPLDASRQMAELRDLLRLALPAGISLEAATPPGPLWIRAMPGLLEQVLMNLVLNARDAMPQGGWIRVCLEPGADLDAGMACLRVTDTGTGMPKAVLDQLFTPFFTTKPAGKGTGLGLASVRALVEQAAGRIEVQSEPGRGTTFLVRFPLWPGAERAV